MDNKIQNRNQDKIQNRNQDIPRPLINAVMAWEEIMRLEWELIASGRNKELTKKEGKGAFKRYIENYSFSTMKEAEKAREIIVEEIRRRNIEERPRRSTEEALRKNIKEENTYNKSLEEKQTSIKIENQKRLAGRNVIMSPFNKMSRGRLSCNEHFTNSNTLRQNHTFLGAQNSFRNINSSNSSNYQQNSVITNDQNLFQTQVLDPGLLADLSNAAAKKNGNQLGRNH